MSLFSPDWCVHVEAFLHAFGLANAGINIHLKFKLSQQTIQRTFSAKIKSKVKRAKQPSLVLDVTCDTRPPDCVRKGRWCEGGHPVIGGRLSLSVPPEAMDQGLFGELSIQLVTFLSPCVLHYPNVSTRLTHIQVLLCNPSNVPVLGPSTFFQNLPAYLDCRELGVRNLLCSSSKDLLHSGGTVYTVNWEDQEQESSSPSILQSLRLFMFLQHNDQFACQLSDRMATEALIEHHLEDILNNNKQAVTAALQTELEKILKVQNRRKRDQEKFHSAAEVILSSSISIVSCSSNMDFRNACLNSMKVQDTYELSASLRESLRTVTSWKFIPKSTCFPAHMDR